MEYSKEDLLSMYYHRVNGRLFTEKMHEAVNNGDIRVSYHTAYGQEAMCVAIGAALRKTDWIVPSHRLQPLLLMRLDPYQLICELFGKRDGLCRGSAFDYHASDLNAHVAVPIATLGCVYPMYTGMGWSLKRQKKDEVIVVLQGDGGVNEGLCYEAWNFAALYKVPVVYVIDNNGWAMSTPLSRESANPNLSDRAIPLGLSTQIVDGSDLLAVRNAMDLAVEKARNFEPNVVEVKNLRWGMHYVGQRDYGRDDAAEIEDAKIHRDCVKLYEDYLIEKGVIDRPYAENLKEECNKTLDDCIKRAKACELTRFEDVYLKEYIYTMPETGGDL